MVWKYQYQTQYWCSHLCFSILVTIVQTFIRIKNVSSIISSYPATLIFLYLFNKLPLKCLIFEDKDRPSSYWTSVLQSCSFLSGRPWLIHIHFICVHLIISRIKAKSNDIIEPIFTAKANYDLKPWG